VSRHEEQDHRLAGATIDAAARAWADREERAVTAHPEPDELVDYQEGRLDRRGAERVQRHLAACAACRDELLRLHAFDEEVPEGSPLLPPEEATERSWRRFQEAREALRPPAEGASRPEPAAGHGLGPPARRRRWLLAASVVLALVAASVLAVLLFGRGGPDRIAGTGSPFVFDLDPVGTVLLRDVATVPEIEVPAGMDPLVARLNLGDLTVHEGYRVEVYDHRDRLALHRDGLVREPSGAITFMAARADWPPGRYRVLLVALDGERRQQLAEYALELRYPA
jgi:hypothetical protein